MIDMDLRQYRFFGYSNWNSIVYDAVTSRIPESKRLFVKTQGDVIDRTMFCHEAAHSMECIRKKEFFRLHLKDYGWDFTDFRKTHWTRKMLDNEARVFAQQELLIEHFKFITDPVLGPENAGLVLMVYGGKKESREYYTDLILRYKDELKLDFLEVFDSFIKYLIENTYESR